MKERYVQSYTSGGRKAGLVEIGADESDGEPAGKELTTGKARADGDQLFDSINEAIQAANRKVTIGPGRFEEAVTVDKPDLQIVGSGRSTLINGDQQDAVFIEEPDVSIRDLDVETATTGEGVGINGTGGGATGGYLDSVRVRRSGGTGFTTSRRDGWVYVNCRSENAGDDGIIATGEYTLLLACQAVLSTTDGIRPGELGTTIGCLSDRAGRYGYNLQDDCSVQGSHCIEAGVQGFVDTATRVSLRGCHAVRTEGNGFLSAGSDGTYIGNVARDNTEDGFALNGTGMVVLGNRAGGNAIDIDDGTENSVVSDNLAAAFQ